MSFEDLIYGKPAEVPQLVDANSMSFPAPNVQRYLNKPLSEQPAKIIKLWRMRPMIWATDLLDVKMDLWQEEVVESYRTQQRIGVVANKGPGKTWLESLLTHHFFSTYYLPKIACLSISEAHLKSNLWAELLKMRMKSKVLELSMTGGATRIAMIGHEGYCFIDARSFPKSADETQMSSTLAGLHADNVMFVLDESGRIPDSIFATADNALSTGDSDTKCAKILAVGNPDEPKGVLYRASKGRSLQKWAIHRVTGDPDDPKRSPRVSVTWAREQIQAYGRDNPWVLVNVFGEYPPTASESLLSEEEIDKSMKRDISEKQVANSQHRLGVDVARGGIDNSAMARRRGLKAYPLELMASNILGPEMAGKIAFMQQDLLVERVFVDNTGGYGSSVIDSLALFPNMDVTPVVYNTKAQDERYYNKRTENWIRMRDWVKKGGQLPNDPMLAEELMMPKVYFHAGKMRLEEKEQIKVRLGRSPDRADALSQTFNDVEQPSFYAEYGITSEGVTNPMDFMRAYQAQSQSNYVSDQSHIDKSFRPAPNYKA